LEQAADLIGLRSTTIWRHESGYRSVSAEAASLYHAVTQIPYSELLRIKRNGNAR
jgi:hypothetical protein